MDWLTIMIWHQTTAVCLSLWHAATFINEKKKIALSVFKLQHVCFGNHSIMISWVQKARMISKTQKTLICALRHTAITTYIQKHYFCLYIIILKKSSQCWKGVRRLCMSDYDDSSFLLFLTGSNGCRHLRLIAPFIQLHVNAVSKFCLSLKNKHKLQKNTLSSPGIFLIHNTQHFWKKTDRIQMFFKIVFAEILLFATWHKQGTMFYT